MRVRYLASFCLLLVFVSVTLCYHTYPCSAASLSAEDVLAQTLSTPHLTTLMHWDRINVTCRFDDGVEIRSVVMYYNYSTFDLTMFRSKGEGYRYSTPMTPFGPTAEKRYCALVLPMSEFYQSPTEGFLYVYVNATDSRGHYLTPEGVPVSQYFYIQVPREPSFAISFIQLGKINYTDLTIPIRVGISVYLPINSTDMSMYPFVIVSAQDEYRGTWDEKIKPLQQFRFQYEGELYWNKAPVWGNPWFIPLDVYKINLTFSVDRGRVTFNDRHSIRYVSFSEHGQYLQWKYSIDYVPKSEGGKVVLVTIVLERTSKVVLYLVVLLFLILGSTLALDTKKYFHQRLMIYLALFTLAFSITGFIRSIQEAELRSMGIDALTIFVLLAVSITTVTSVIGKVLVEELRCSTLDMASDLIGVCFLVLFLFFVPVYETQWGKTSLAEYLPWWPLWIFGPLFAGLVSSYIIRRRRRRILEDVP